jgi:hypothetical protein
VVRRRAGTLVDVPIRFANWIRLFWKTMTGEMLTRTTSTINWAAIGWKPNQVDLPVSDDDCCALRIDGSTSDLDWLYLLRGLVPAESR